MCAAPELKDVLKPLYEVTVELSAELSVTVSKVIPLTGMLLEFYDVGDEFEITTAEAIEKFCYYIFKSVEERLGKKVENKCMYLCYGNIP